MTWPNLTKPNLSATRKTRLSHPSLTSRPVRQVTTITQVAKAALTPRSHGSPRAPYSSGGHGHACRHDHPVAQVAMVAPRSNTAGTLLLFNNWVRTAKKTQHFTITKMNLLTLFEEIIAVYSENHTKQNMQTYRLSSRLDRYLPLGFKGLILYESWHIGHWNDWLQTGQMRCNSQYERWSVCLHHLVKHACSTSY
jgi:hypothetical protein